MSSRLRAGLLGQGSAVTSVTDMLAFRQYGFGARFTPLVVSTPTPTSYLSVVTPVLVAGLYHVKVDGFVDGSAQGTDLSAIIEVDGFALPVFITEAAVTGGGFLLTGLPPQDWSAGDSTHTFEIFVAQPVSPGFLTAHVASVSWERKS